MKSIRKSPNNQIPTKYKRNSKMGINIRDRTGTTTSNVSPHEY